MVKTKIAVLAALVALILLAAGCGDDGPSITTGADGTADGEAETTDEGEPRPIDLGVLQDGTWVLRSGGGPDGEVPIVQGWPITLTFGPEDLGGTAACNGYGASYRLDGSRLTIAEVASTDMGCEPEVMAAESAYLAALRDVDAIDLVPAGDDGWELALSGMATELIFASTDPAPVADLVGPLWLLEGRVENDELFPVEGEPATLRLNDDGSFEGSTGCRTLVGRYVVSGREVIFNEMSADGDCPGSLQDQDGFVIGVLGDGFVPTVAGDQLIVVSTGDQELRYRSSSEDEVSALPPSDAPSDTEALQGVEWVFAGGDTESGPIADPRTIDPDAVITVTFTDGRYDGVAVCNAYGGAADIGQSLWSFTLGPAEGEQEGCGDELDPIIDAYLAALPGMIEGGVEADGERLVMNDGVGVELLFERAD